MSSLAAMLLSRSHSVWDWSQTTSSRFVPVQGKILRLWGLLSLNKSLSTSPELWLDVSILSVYFALQACQKACEGRYYNPRSKTCSDSIDRVYQVYFCMRKYLPTRTVSAISILQSNSYVEENPDKIVHASLFNDSLVGFYSGHSINWCLESNSLLGDSDPERPNY